MSEAQQKDPSKYPIGDVAKLPRRTLGQMIVLQVHKKSATAMILTALEDIHLGDGVEVMDVSEAPEVQPVKAAELAPGTPTTETTISSLPKIACSAAPTSVRVAERSTISCAASSPHTPPLPLPFPSTASSLS